MAQDAIEVTVVFPCLNEENTIGACVRAARDTLAHAGLSGEVVVADNDSTDRSRDIALAEGARVVEVRQPGYGNALRTGIREARAERVVFLDADMSYECADIPQFVRALRDGADLAIGSRFRGSIDPGAMPWLHRVVGTPAMTLLANLLFGCRISDINCGMRGLTRDAFARLDLHSDGMELASEMMIKAAQAKMRITEIPIAFHADQRGRRPHLRSFRDGWRHLQVMFHFCSIWLFLLPGLVLTLAGLGAIWRLPHLRLDAAFVRYLFAQCATALGVQILLLGLTAQSRVKYSKFYRGPDTKFFQTVRRWLRLETSIVLSLLAAAAGMVLLTRAAIHLFGTGETNGPAFNYTDIRAVFLGATLIVCSLQVFFTSLFLGLFGIRVAADEPGFWRKQE